MLSLNDTLPAALLTLGMALGGGLLPLYLQTHNKKAQHFLRFGEWFAKGVFLGAGLIHFLREACELTHGSTHVFSVCALTIVLLYIIEKNLPKLLKEEHASFCCPSQWPFLLVLFLSIHSILAGFALGLQASAIHFGALLLAIVAHKGAAAFALGVNLKKQHTSPQKHRALIACFACMTPLGILFGTVFHATSLSLHSASIGFFNAVAAGTFIYIATFDKTGLNTESPEHCGRAHERIASCFEILYFVGGLMLMMVTAQA